MGYHTSNAAYAYDMNSAPAYREEAPRVQAPQTGERPQFSVYTGAGNAANQVVSPVFTHVIKVFAVLAAVFCVLGLGRVTLASMTAATLNANAATASSLEKAQAETRDLEVMRSVYGSDTRIRDLATGYGMTDSEGSVTLDFSSGSTGSTSAQQ